MKCMINKKASLQRRLFLLLKPATTTRVIEAYFIFSRSAAKFSRTVTVVG